MIELKKVNKYFNRHRKNQVHVIDNTSLKLDEKGLVSFLGNSGCGKTTLLNVIGGLDKFQRGKIYINGKKITKFNYWKMDKIRNLHIGYIFQDYKLVDNLSVYDNISLVLKMIGIKNKKEIKKRVDYVLNKTGMYRYRNRMANMLSGGERQRVGIARALVKNPDIILADEPTGNLDSKNSIEIMNIIKSISKNRLVILVTHEVNLAKFYSDRIIELEDGKVVKDYKNKNEEDLDYRMDSKIYLKDFKIHKKIKEDDMNINVYTDNKETTDINIVFKNGNIYIESNGKEKIEIIDEDSSIELVNDHYKKISKDIYEDYKFDLEEVIDKNRKLRYSSIYNPITLIIEGFKKVFNYSVLKKLLLIGFFLTGLFMIYSTSSIFRALKIDEENFVTTNRNYLLVNASKISIDDFNKYSSNPDINYVLPGDSNIGLKVLYDDYYQSHEVKSLIEGSLSSISMLKKKDLIYGRMPKDTNEIVIDKMVANKFLKTNTPNYVGITSIDKIIGLKVYDMIEEEFIIVGISDLVSPSIYMNNDVFISVLSNKYKEDDIYDDEEILLENKKLDYDKFKDKIYITKGRIPENDYEAIVHKDNEETMKLNKEIDDKIAGRKLKVVGYYDTIYNYTNIFVNTNTIKAEVISNNKKLSIYPKDKDKVIKEFRESGVNISETYQLARQKYINESRDSVVEKLIVAGVMIGISLVEIFLMMRSSFLSRIKEIGILRAIGVKKTDIVKMFLGEIIAISTIGGVTGILFMSYIISLLMKVSYMRRVFMLNPFIILLTMIIMYLFNMIVGLIPVFNILRKTPAQILSRHDIE